MHPVLVVRQQQGAVYRLAVHPEPCHSALAVPLAVGARKQNGGRRRPSVATLRPVRSVRQPPRKPVRGPVCLLHTMKAPRSWKGASESLATALAR